MDEVEPDWQLLRRNALPSDPEMPKDPSMQQTIIPRFPNRYATWAIAGAMSAFLVAPGMAWAINEATSLARGAQPDTTAQHRYQSAREECGQQPVSERKNCNVQAQANYKQDMARAQAMLRDPKVQPVNEAGGPVRSTETTTVVKP